VDKGKEREKKRKKEKEGRQQLPDLCQFDPKLGGKGKRGRGKRKKGSNAGCINDSQWRKKKRRKKKKKKEGMKGGAPLTCIPWALFSLQPAIKGGGKGKKGKKEKMIQTPFRRAGRRKKKGNKRTSDEKESISCFADGPTNFVFSGSGGGGGGREGVAKKQDSLFVYFVINMPPQ